jgi:hypothetical protein
MATIAIATRWRFGQLVDAHTPFVEWDTQVFEQIAELPLSPGLVVSSKPLIVPLVYRAAHNDALRIIGFQAELSFWAWAILTASVTYAVRRRWVRLLAAGIGAAFLLEPMRIGFTGSLMPESVNDSLLALCAAGAIALVRLTGPARRAAAVATGVLTIAWLFTRDTNAFIAMTAAALAMIIWRGWRSRAAWGLSALVAVCAAITLWSASVAHEPLPFQRTWYAGFTPRSAFPTLNNLTVRVRRDEPDAFPATLRQFDDAWLLLPANPDLRPLQDWMAQHGAAIYARWLVRHPIDRIIAVVEFRWELLTANLSHYMPGHWVQRRRVSFRTLTSNRWVLRLLLLASPLVLWRPRGDRLRGVILCIAVSAIVGIFASYYGDAIELTRHCYGASQQLVLGLFLASIAWLDGVRRTRAGVAASVNPATGVDALPDRAEAGRASAIGGLE